MGKMRLGRVLDCLCLPCSNSSCFCMNELDDEAKMEKKAFIVSDQGKRARLRDLMDGNQTLAYQLKPKMVVLRVSMHCDGCAKRVQKHIKKIEGVTSIEVDLESKKVVVIGDIVPFEVLESVSRLKYAELWDSPY